MTELLAELRRSPAPGDREVAELLHALQPADDRRPRASEALAAFIAERGSGVTTPAELQAQAGQSSLLVVLGGAADPKPARRRVMTGAWAPVAAAAAIALVAVAIATGGPSRDVVVRPTNSSSTVAPPTTTPADQADPTPRRQPPVAPTAIARPHRARAHPAATGRGTPDRAASLAGSTPAAGDAESGRETEDELRELDDNQADETASGTDDTGGGTADDGISTDAGETSDMGDGETPDGVDE